MFYAAPPPVQPQPGLPVRDLRPHPHAAPGPLKRRQLVPSAGGRPHPFARAVDVRAGSPPSPALPGVSALLQPRPASAAGPRKRSLSGPSPADGRGSPTSPRSVYMNLVDPSRPVVTSATITPRGHPLHFRPHPSRDQRASSASAPHAYACFVSSGGRVPMDYRTVSASASASAFRAADPAGYRMVARHPLAGPLGMGAPWGRSGPLVPTSADGGPSSPAPAASSSAKTPKPSRYLREMDRRVILARIGRGEKQSALAKEFHVSRAAICNLYKHRDEVLSRRDGNPLAKHPKKPRVPKAADRAPKPLSAALGTGPASHGTGSARVHELRTRAAALLLTALRTRDTSADAFQRGGARLARLVLEEALALVPLTAVAVPLVGGGSADGVAPERAPCALGLSSAADGSSSPADGRNALLDAFVAMEPEQPAGRVRTRGDGGADGGWGPLDGGRVPSSLDAHNVLLLEPVAARPGRTLSAVRTALAHGAVEARVSLVALVVTKDVADALRTAFPAVRIVAAQVEPSGDEERPGADAKAAVEALGHRLAHVVGTEKHER